MQIIRGIFGTVSIRDCFSAMKKMEDGTFDFSFADPPFNNEFAKKAFCRGGKKYDGRGKIIPYKDDKTIAEYITFLRHLVSELARIAKCVIIHPGYDNEILWIREVRAPDFTLSWRVLNPKSGGGQCHLRRRSPLLGYGKPNKQFVTDEFEGLSLWGFVPHDKLDHPCPMNAAILEKIIAESGATRAYDPMTGSGAFPEACESLGVEYYANDNNPAYYNDISSRVKKGIAKHTSKQRLDKMLGGK